MIANAEIVGNELVIGSVAIGADAGIGTSCVISHDTVIGDHAEIADLTTIPAGTRVARPSGGFVLWVEMPSGVSALDLHDRALDRGISVAPGPLFSAKHRFLHCVRLNCGFPWSDLLDHGVRTLGRLAAEMAGS